MLIILATYCVLSGSNVYRYITVLLLVTQLYLCSPPDNITYNIQELLVNNCNLIAINVPFLFIYSEAANQEKIYDSMCTA